MKNKFKKEILYKGNKGYLQLEKDVTIATVGSRLNGHELTCYANNEEIKTYRADDTNLERVIEAGEEYIKRYLDNLSLSTEEILINLGFEKTKSYT